MVKNCVTIVFDNVPGGSRGHYLQLVKDLSMSFERSKRNSIIVTRNSFFVKWFETQEFSNVQVELLPDSEDKSIFKSTCALLDETKCKLDQNIHLFFLRASAVSGADFEKIKICLSEYQNVDLKLLINVSAIISNSPGAESESLTLAKFRNLGMKARFLAWDQRVIGNSEFADFQFLPEAKLDYPRSYFPPSDTIGFYGKLSSTRGLFDVLVFVFLNPKLKFRIMGYGFDSRYLYRSKKFVSVKETPFVATWNLAVNYLVLLATKFRRVEFKIRYFLDEAEISDELQRCTAIYFSCERSPYSSGIVYQSLASGVPVVWTDGNSAMSFVLRKKFPKGRISPKHKFRLNEISSTLTRVKDELPTPIFSYKVFDEIMDSCRCKSN